MQKDALVQTEGKSIIRTRFRRQQIILGFIVDFYCHEARLAIEVDGGVHDERKDYDAKRDSVLGSNNIGVIRVSNEDVMTKLGSALETISSALARRSGLT